MIKLVETPVSIKLLADNTQKDREDLKFLRQCFDFRPPEYWRSPKYELYKKTNGKYGWDGYLHPLQVRDGRLGLIKRGRLFDLLNYAKTEGIELNVEGLLARPFVDLQPDDLPDDLTPGAPFKLDENQRFCIVQWLRRGIGICRVTVSGGKTITFCAAAAYIKRRYPTARFLYITLTERLVRQVTKEARKFLPDWNISQYGGGEKDNTGTDMVVATSAMLWKNFDSLTDWFRSFMGLLFDESHHAASKSNESICLATPAYFRFAASDTMKEDDIVKSNKIAGLFGNILHEVKVEGLIESGRVARPHIYLVDIPAWKNTHEIYSHTASPDTPAWALIDDKWHKGVYMGQAYEKDAYGEFKEDPNGNLKQAIGKHLIQIGKETVEVESRWCLLQRTYDKAIIQNKARNNLIATWAKYYTDKGWPTLIVCTRTLHVLILQKLLSDKLGKNKVRILFSHHSSKERDKTFDWFKKTEGSCLITPLVKEGVSINEIKAGVIADYIADWEFGNQIMGRFIRKKIEGQENEAHITWFIDNQHPNLRRGSKALIKNLQKIDGYYWYHPCSFPEDVATALRYDYIK